MSPMSNRVTSTPARASTSPATSPTGPPPAMITLRSTGIGIPERLARLLAERPEHRLRGERQLGEPHADRVVDGIGNRRRQRQRSRLPRPLGAERPVRLIG